MSIVKARKDVIFLKKKLDVSIRRPSKHIRFLNKKGGTSIPKIRINVTVLRVEMVMSILRVSKVITLCVQMGIFLSEGNTT